jgi:hypothetical protein
MAMLIVGGDRIDRLRQAMIDRGLGPVEHWNGRKRGEAHKSLPPGVDLVVILWHQVSHMLLRNVRDQASRRGVPVLYSRQTSAAQGEALAASGAELVELAARWLDDPKRPVAATVPLRGRAVGRRAAPPAATQRAPYRDEPLRHARGGRR